MTKPDELNGNAIDIRQSKKLLLPAFVLAPQRVLPFVAHPGLFASSIKARGMHWRYFHKNALGSLMSHFTEIG